MAQKLNLVIVAEKPLDPHAEVDIKQVAYIGFDADAASRIYRAAADEGLTVYEYRRLAYRRKKYNETASEKAKKAELERLHQEQIAKKLEAQVQELRNKAAELERQAETLSGTAPEVDQPKRRGRPPREDSE